MPLGKIQTTIVNSLRDAGRIDAAKCKEIADTPEELTGNQLDKVLLSDHGVTPFQLQVAKSKAFKLAPFNVARFQPHAATFERVPEEFCKENQVIPVGEVGGLLLVAVANPFDVTLLNKIKDMCGLEVVRLLGLQSWLGYANWTT